MKIDSRFAVVFASVLAASSALAQNAFPSSTAQPRAPTQYPSSSAPPPPAQRGDGSGAIAAPERTTAEEGRDFGVAPVRELHAGAMHGPTPVTIPGAQVITTKALATLVQNRRAPHYVIDVLGGPETLPGAIPLVWAAQGGTFDDPVQQQFVRVLQQGTQGNKEIPLIFYCLSSHCWMSYNAALRAVNAGYRNVLWYRGGIEAWKAAGLPTTQGSQAGYGAAAGAAR